MFSTISRSFAVVMTFVILAAAMPNGSPPATTTTVTVTAPASTSTPASSCAAPDLQSCQSLDTSTSPTGSLLLATIGVLVSGVTVPIGVDCSPIDVIDVGSSPNAVCCENNNFHGLVSLGCVPVTV